MGAQVRQDKISGAIGADANGVESPTRPTGMAELVEAFDWAATPLGPMKSWANELKNTVRILLTSRFSMWMAWGPELTILYNDSYAKTTLGKKHPWALGRPAAKVWSEIWKDIGPRIQRVMETGEASWDETLMLILERSGYPEETYHTFSYSPLEEAGGKVSGMLCVVIEDTVRVIGERQLATLSMLSGELARAITKDDVFAAIVRGLTDQKDLPCTLTYLVGAGGSELYLAACTGFGAGHPAAADTVNLDAQPAAWAFRDVLESMRAVTVDNLQTQFPALPPGPWEKAPTRARIVPMARPGQENPVGVFITALNPYREFDSFYSEFLDLVAGQIGSSIMNAQAYEDERKRAESLATLDRAKTTFFSNVSHELRTPLTSIQGYVETLIEDPNPGSATSREFLGIILKNASRMSRLTEDLLALASVESPDYKLSLQPARASALVKDAIESLGGMLVDSGIKLQSAGAPEALVMADPDAMNQVFGNLIENSLKYAKDGKRIRVGARELGNEVQFTIQDFGPGIASEHLERIFERFYRVDKARSRESGGTGLGLAIVKHIVQAHGGHIWAESELGSGAAFHFTLPLAPLPPGSPKPAETPSATPTTVPETAS
jgi:signal transduction histidine kinase